MQQKSPYTARQRARLVDRGLGPYGGGWNLRQASAWCGIGERKLRELAKRRLTLGDQSVFPCIAIGRRIVISRNGFMRWFNNGGFLSSAGADATAR